MAKKKKTILVVDDEPNIVELIKLTLGDEYNFLTAYNGQDTIKIAHEKHPDLILLDIMMPGMDGYEVAKALRSSPDTKDIVIVMVSAKKEDHDILAGIDTGAVAYITKPFKPMEFEEKVKELLELTD